MNGITNVQNTRELIFSRTQVFSENISSTVQKGIEVGFKVLSGISKLGSLSFLGLSLLTTVGNCQQIGNEFLVYSDPMSDQMNPAIATSKSGRIAVVWERVFPSGNLSEIFGKTYLPNGEIACDAFQINEYQLNNQASPAIAFISNETFMVTWSSDQQAGGNEVIVANIFDENCFPTRSEFLIHPNTTDAQTFPSIGVIPDDSILVAWQSSSGGGDGNEVLGQLYTINVSKVGEAFQLNNYTNSNQGLPSVAGLASNEFGTAWHSQGQDGSGNGVYGQIFAVNGTPVREEFRINQLTADAQFEPKVAGLSYGGFVIGFASRNHDGSGWGIYQRPFAPDGKIGVVSQVNTYTEGDQYHLDISGLESGEYVIVWESVGQIGNFSGIFGQMYAQNKSALGDEFLVNVSTVNIQRAPSIAGHKDGGFMIVWHRIGQGANGIFGLRYNSSGAPIPLRISSELSSSSETRSMTNFSRSSSATTHKSSTASEIDTTQAPNLSSQSTQSSSNTSSRVSISEVGSSSLPVTQQASSQTPSEILSITVLSYNTEYPIFYNGEQIGTFSITGGEGGIQADLQNTVQIVLDDSAYENEDLIVLFTLPSDEWNLTLAGEFTGCQAAIEEINETPQGEYEYVVDISESACIASANKLERLAGLLGAAT